MATSYESRDEEMDIEVDSHKAIDARLIKKPDTEEKKDFGGERENVAFAQKKDDEEYIMTNKPRGKAIIFNHFKYDFKLNIEEREGTDKDKDRIIKILTDLGFETEPYEDRKFSEIKEILEEVSNNYDPDYDCLIVVVMSHGCTVEVKNRAGKIGKTTEIQAFDRSYSEEELWKAFTEGKCDQNLLGKPKLFFIQACRSEDGTDKRNTGSFVTPSKSQKEGSTTSEKPLEFYSIPDVADLLIARSTFEGCAAYRHTEEGTYFIQTLCSELEKDKERQDDEKHDLLRLLTNVNRTVAFGFLNYTATCKKQRTAQFKQMPNFYSTLTRLLYFKNLPET